VAEDRCKTCSFRGNRSDSKTDILWVGLSAKKGSEEFPLSPDTNTGRIVRQIEEGLLSTSFTKTNLVQCAPVDCNNRLRYPTRNEMESCFYDFQNRLANLQPRLVLLLGLMVAQFVLGDQGIAIHKLDSEFNYDIHKWDNVEYMPIHHPSFIHIYKRKQLPFYISRVQDAISQTI